MSDAHDSSDLVAPSTGQPLPTATEARTQSPLFLKAITEMAADHTTTRQRKGNKEGHQHNTASKSLSRRAKREQSIRIRELQNIDALNLEPGRPDFSVKHWPHEAWVQQLKQRQQTTTTVKGNRKDEFEQDLEVINRSVVLPLGSGNKQRAKPPSTQKTQTKQAAGSNSAHSWQ
jgi:hypothetical protein